MDRVHPNDRGVRSLFGKRYLWLLSFEGVLGLHKVDDHGSEESRERLKKRLEDLQQKDQERLR